MAPGALPEDGGLKAAGLSKNGILVARLRDETFTGQPGSQLLCCMTHDLISNCWQIQALYD